MEATSVYYIWLYDLEDILRRNRFLFFLRWVFTEIRSNIFTLDCVKDQESYKKDKTV